MRRFIMTFFLTLGIGVAAGGTPLTADEFALTEPWQSQSLDGVPTAAPLNWNDGNCNQTGTCQNAGSRWFGGLDYLLVRTHFSEALAFARVQDSGPVPPAAPPRVLNVQSEELDFDYTSSFRSTIGYHLNDCADLRFTYWFLDVDTLVNGTPGAGEVLIDPYGGISPAGTSMAALADVRMNVYDLEYVRPLHFTRPHLGFEYTAGLRFADVEQFSSSTVNAGPAVISQGVFTADFFGIGPYMSMKGKVTPAHCERLGLTAKMGTALLVGHYEVTSGFTAPGVITAGQSAERTRLVPVFEAELGSEWKPAHWLTFSSGWFFQGWANLGASGGTFDAEATLGLDAAFVGTDDADIMSFDGLFVRGEAKF